MALQLVVVCWQLNLCLWCSCVSVPFPNTMKTWTRCDLSKHAVMWQLLLNSWSIFFCNSWLQMVKQNGYNNKTRKKHSKLIDQPLQVNYLLLRQLSNNYDINLHTYRHNSLTEIAKHNCTRKWVHNHVLPFQLNLKD